jgi:cell division septal protein FtsQ
MNTRLLITLLALGLLLLALGGWLVQALRWPSRSLVAPAR